MSNSLRMAVRTKPSSSSSETSLPGGSGMPQNQTSSRSIGPMTQGAWGSTSQWNRARLQVRIGIQSGNTQDQGDEGNQRVQPLHLDAEPFAHGAACTVRTDEETWR